MSNNPSSATLVRPGIDFCLAHHPKDAELICTRIDQHDGHCCDEVVGQSWDARGHAAVCDRNHDHSKEKGLVKR